VIVSHIAFSVPFVTLVVQARLQGFDKSYEEAAMDLGANEWTTFRRVTFPMILPGILSGGLLAFTLSLDDFVITFLRMDQVQTSRSRMVCCGRSCAAGERVSTVWILTVFVRIIITGASKPRTKTELTNEGVRG
jgi:spermidine/putrescine transport system permease protein